MMRFVLIIVFSLVFVSCGGESALSPNVKEFLETAETIELLTVADRENDKLIFDVPLKGKFNYHAVVSDKETKTKLLNSFFSEATGDAEVACFVPRHLLRAIKQGEIIEIEICYECWRFIGTGDLGDFEGGISGTKSKEIINQFITAEGAEIKE